MAEVKQLADIKALLKTGRFRLDFDNTMMVVNGEFRTTPCARLYEKRGDRRWVKVGPLLLPPEGGDSAALMEVLALALTEAARG